MWSATDKYTIDIHLWLNNPVKNISNHSASKSWLKAVKATGPANTSIKWLLAKPACMSK